MDRTTARMSARLGEIERLARPHCRPVGGRTPATPTIAEDRRRLRPNQVQQPGIEPARRRVRRKAEHCCAGELLIEDREDGLRVVFVEEIQRQVADHPFRLGQQETSTGEAVQFADGQLPVPALDPVECLRQMVEPHPLQRRDPSGRDAGDSQQVRILLV